MAMTFDDALQAWVSDGDAAPECPVCGSPLSPGWNDCPCGMELNVETITTAGGTETLVTQEHDEMRELRDRLEGDGTGTSSIALL